MKYLVTLLPIFVLSACTITVVERQPEPITPNEYALLDNPPQEMLTLIEKHLPKMNQLTRNGEARALKYGRVLTEQELILAKQVGVKHPEKIRIYVTKDFPIVEGFFSSVAAVTMNYGIYVKPKITKRQGQYYEIITHEFAHVVQFEDIGIEGMSRRLILENFVFKDKLRLVEREAIAMGEAVYNDPYTSYGF